MSAEIVKLGGAAYCLAPPIGELLVIIILARLFSVHSSRPTVAGTDTKFRHNQSTIWVC